MAKFKTIVAPITLMIAKGEDPIQPGTPVRLPEEDADSIIERFGAVEYVEEKPKKVANGKKGDDKGEDKDKGADPAA